MDSTGGFWLHRWGNNPFRTFAVGLLLDDVNVSSLVLPYAHQDYCSCAGAGACTWDAVKKSYNCQEAGEGSGKVGVDDLAIGLLDLQPWRGTERQKKRFDA